RRGARRLRCGRGHRGAGGRPQPGRRGPGCGRGDRARGHYLIMRRAQYALLGTAAGLVDLALWAARPVLRTARSVTTACGPAEMVTSVLAERGRRARADLELAADTVL